MWYGTNRLPSNIKKRARELVEALFVFTSDEIEKTMYVADKAFYEKRKGKKRLNK